jgi:hypothetical protein
LSERSMVKLGKVSQVTREKKPPIEEPAGEVGFP